jgi:hypothetical protein
MANGGAQMRRCGTHQPSTGDRARIAELEGTFFRTIRIPEALRQIEIPVRFIHIVSGENGRVTAQQRKDQIDVLNAAYQPHGITFGFDEGTTTVLDNHEFFTMGHRSLRERRCKQQHQAIEPQKGLNFYTAAPGGGLLGWATFPHEMEGDPDMDGVVMLHGTLQGGSTTNYNLGATAVHEVGHWLGLFHTFQDACFELGDEVEDTPPHSGPNYGKPVDEGQPHNLCPTAPAGSLCPIHNYMNYVDDEWMTEFTPGQVERLWAQIAMFRTDLLGAALAGAELEMPEGAEGLLRVRW